MFQLSDDDNLLVAPVIAGGGNPYLPREVAAMLERIDERRFANGLVHLQYRA